MAITKELSEYMLKQMYHALRMSTMRREIDPVRVKTLPPKHRGKRGRRR